MHTQVTIQGNSPTWPFLILLVVFCTPVLSLFLSLPTLPTLPCGGLSAASLSLKQACRCYEAALALKPSSHAALYNWGVALSDLARSIKAADPKAATSALHLASQKYAQSLQLHPRNPQALNNWGLVLQVCSIPG